jgi:hypothetical protein
MLAHVVGSVKTDFSDLTTDYDAVLLPLTGGKYVIFETLADQAYAVPVTPGVRGTPIPIQGKVTSALELSDGSYVVLYGNASGSASGQRFTSEHVAMGDVFVFDTQGVIPALIATSGGGFAIAWTGTDIFRQRFTPASIEPPRTIGKRPKEPKPPKEAKSPKVK